jgi:hypothetical protein
MIDAISWSDTIARCSTSRISPSWRYPQSSGHRSVSSACVSACRLGTFSPRRSHSCHSRSSVTSLSLAECGPVRRLVVLSQRIDDAETDPVGQTVCAMTLQRGLCVIAAGGRGTGGTYDMELMLPHRARAVRMVVDDVIASALSCDGGGLRFVSSPEFGRRRLSAATPARGVPLALRARFRAAVAGPIGIRQHKPPPNRRNTKCHSHHPPTQQH